MCVGKIGLRMGQIQICIFGGARLEQEKNRGAGDPCCGLYWGSSARRSCHSIKSGRSKGYRGATDMARRGLST